MALNVAFVVIEVFYGVIADSLALITDAGHNLSDVLGLLVEGLNSTRIADRLVVSPSTIKSHVSHIRAKLDVASRGDGSIIL